MDIGPTLGSRGAVFLTGMERLPIEVDHQRFVIMFNGCYIKYIFLYDGCYSKATVYVLGIVEDNKVVRLLIKLTTLKELIIEYVLLDTFKHYFIG